MAHRVSMYCRGLPALGLLAFLIAAAAVPLAAQEERTESVSDPERAAIEAVIRDYLRDNPEIIIEAIQTYQEDQRLAEEQRQKDAVTAHKALLEEDADSPVIGNPEGSVVLVEFFDYRCTYCKASAPRLQAAIAENPDLKVVMKEFPILSEQSFEGARAALAAALQGRYEAFHFALMANPGNLSERHLRAIAAQSGVDAERMLADMKSEAIDEAIRRNHQLASALNIRGTPAFVIGDQLYGGALGEAELRDAISRARAAGES